MIDNRSFYAETVSEQVAAGVHAEVFRRPASRIRALQDAIEGECEGLGISEDQARRILEHLDRA